MKLKQKNKQKAMSPLMATILLVVVAVILVTVVLNWGKAFTTSNLDQTNPIVKETNNIYMVDNIKLNAQGYLSFKNYTN